MPQYLIVTNMYPSKELPYSGIFVQGQFNRIAGQLEPDESVRIFFMRQRVTGKLVSVLKYLWAYFRFVPHLFRSYQAVHVHFLGILTPLVVLYKFLHPNTKLLVTAHGGDINDDLAATGIKNKLFRKWARSFDVVIPVGEALHQPLADKLDLAPSMTLCAGVDPNTFYPEERPLQRDFLVVGSLLPVKGLDVLLEAIRLVDDPNLTFSFVGNGPLEPEVRQAAETYPITLLGNKTQSELRSLYSESKFLLFTSRGDAFGLVVTESIFCGTPAVVCADGGAQYQVQHGTNGFVYAANTPEILAQQIRDCRDMDPDAYAQLRTSTRDTNRQFGLDHVCDVLLEEYRTPLHLQPATA